MSNKKTDEQLLLSKIKNSQSIYLNRKVIETIGADAGIIYALLIVKKLEQDCNNDDTDLNLVYDINKLSHTSHLSKQKANDVLNILAHHRYIKVINAHQIVLNNFEQEIDKMKQELLK